MTEILTLDPLDPDLPIPLYHQIYKSIRDEIRSGRIPTGTIIPGENQIAKSLDVSRITVKRALNELAQDGLVSRRRGRGTVVIANTRLNFHDGMSNYVKNVATLRRNTDADILERTITGAPERVQNKLKLPPKANVEKICHTLSMNSKPLSYVETYVPEGLLADLTDADIKREPVLTLLRRVGVRVSRAEQRIFAVNANQALADILEVEIGSPLLKIHCVMFDTHDRPVEDIYAWYDSDRYQYRMNLTDIDQPQG